MAGTLSGEFDMVENIRNLCTFAAFIFSIVSQKETMRRLSKIVTALFLTVIGLSSAFCQNEKPAIDYRHSVRIGWGDMITETILFRPTLSGTWSNPNALPDNYLHHETFDFGYTGHLFTEYQYRLTKVTSLGIQADMEGIFWKEGVFDKYHNLVSEATSVRNWDVTLLATARFTYFDRPWVRLYSGLGVGVLFAFDNQGGFGAAPAFNLNWIGAEVGKGPWGGSFELGGLNALANTKTFYQFFSRIFSLSFYYKW